MSSRNFDQRRVVAPVEPLEPRQLFAAAAGVPAFTQVNLVSDGAVAAQHTDANLVNAWGLAFNKAGVVWVGDNGTGTTTVYDASGNVAGPVVAIPPAAGGADNAAVTGVAFNAAGRAFNITGNGQTVPSEYVFVSEDGTIAGWDPAVGNSAVNVVDNSAAGAVYKGVAIAGKGKKAHLLAANFHAGTIDVFDANFQPVAGAGFTDPSLPAGMSPFNVQVIGSKVYVTYAQSDANFQPVAGPGNGVVNVFDLKGNLKQHLVTGGALNSPWAVVQGTGKFKSDVLVGNFGDGTINVFNAKKGTALGPAKDSTGQPVSIPGLWGLAYGVGANKNKLFFAAGPNDESNGLFGTLTPVSPAATPAIGGTDGTGSAVGSGGIYG
jgi:uncharacterized protein (TIGR03118 family)